MHSALTVLLAASFAAVTGYFSVFWVAEQGYYGIIIPGALIGLSAGLARNESTGMALFCGILAVLTSLLAEWRLRPFLADATLGYFLANLHHLQPVTLFMIGLGGIVGFWIPYRRVDEFSSRNGD